MDFLILLNEDCVMPKYDAIYDKGTRLTNVGKFSIKFR